MTIYDIKRLTAEKAPYFFSKDTLRFFRQTMRSFKIKVSPSGRVFIYARMPIGWTFREFRDNDLVRLPAVIETLSAFMDYVGKN